MIISDRLGNRISAYMADANIIPKDKTAHYAYCYSFLLDKVFFSFYIIAITVLLKHPDAAIILFSVLIPLRCLCGGIHADSQLVCSIISFILPVCIVITAYLPLNFPRFIELIVFVLSLVTTILVSPVDSLKNPMRDSKKRKLKRTLLIYSPLLILIFLILFCSHNANQCNMIALCVLCNSISVFLGKIKYRRKAHDL